MSKKLKLALRNCSTEHGFAIPIAVGMGLVMILIGATMIVRSQGNEVTASAQKATAGSLGIAETGTTRVQSLLNRYRTLANITLTNIATTPPSSSWKQAYDTSPVCGAGGGTTEVSGYRLNEWIGLTSGGQFRVTNYTYKPSSGPIDSVQVTGSIPASGSSTVTVSNAVYLADGSSVDGQIEGIQGTLSRSGSGYTFKRLFSGTAITSSTRDFFPATTPGTGILEVEGQLGANIKATSHLQVNIPVQSGNIATVPIPGVFLGTGGTGNNTIQGNVLLKDCATSTASVSVTGTDPSTGQPYKAFHSNLAFPDLPIKPSFYPSQILGTINGSSMSGLGAVSIGGSHQRLTLPRVGDTPNGSVYEYSVSSISIPNNSELVITPGQKVKLYLDGNIASGGDIIHDCASLPTCQPTDFQIFGYGSTGSEICMSGNNYIEAFIFAPNYAVGVAGSGVVLEVSKVLFGHMTGVTVAVVVLIHRILLSYKLQVGLL